MYFGGKASGISGKNSHDTDVHMSAAPYLSSMWGCSGSPYLLPHMLYTTVGKILLQLCPLFDMVANIKFEGTKSSVMLKIILMMAAGLKCRQCMVVPYHILELPEGKVGHPYVADLVITSSDSESSSAESRSQT